MRFTAVLSVAAFAGLTMAQSQSGPGQGCTAQNVLVTCLGTQAGRISTCKPLDYACMCQIQADVLQCYDQCPNDINRSTEESKLTAWCVAASAAVTTNAPTATASTFKVETSATGTNTEEAPEATETGTETSNDDDAPSSTESSKGSASPTGDAPSAAAKITWMCASSLLAVLTAALMAL